MTTQTLTTLRQLKLGGMASALQSQLEQVGTYEGLAFTERLALLVEQECLSRDPSLCHRPEGVVIFRKPERRACQCDALYVGGIGQGKPAGALGLSELSVRTTSGGQIGAGAAGLAAAEFNNGRPKRVGSILQLPRRLPFFYKGQKRSLTGSAGSLPGSAVDPGKEVSARFARM